MIPAVIRLARLFFYKIRAKYLACKGGDESPRAEGTKNYAKRTLKLSF
jgi:hypothetical protein